MVKNTFYIMALTVLTLANVYSCQHELDQQYAYERTKTQQWQAELDHNFSKGE